MSTTATATTTATSNLCFRFCCEGGVIDTGFVSVCFVIFFGAILLFFGPLVAIIFAFLTMAVFVISHEARGRRRLQEVAASTRLQQQQPSDIEAQVAPSESPVQTVDTSLLILRKVQKDDPIVTCEICLDDVIIGEELAGSTNKDCIHEFHTDCILQALHRQSTCPCCRREYLNPMEVSSNPAATNLDSTVPNIPAHEIELTA